MLIVYTIFILLHSEHYSEIDINNFLLDMDLRGK